MNEFKNKQIFRNDICKTLHTISNITECMSNGLWNLFYNQNLEGTIVFFFIINMIFYLSLFSRDVQNMLYALHK